MSDEKANIIKGWPVYLVFVILIILIIWAWKKQSEQPKPILSPPIAKSTDTPPNDTTTPDPTATHTHDQLATPLPETTAPDTSPTTSKPMTILDIISNPRRMWNPIWTDWYGKPAPNFKFTDINGKEHRLSEYRGKDVIINFWATWCPPCNMEIPDLIELRNEKSANEFALLALSDEDPTKIKQFAQQKNLNYTVASVQTRLPQPFSYIRAIPSACFIDKKGNIKMATEGVVTIQEIRAILQIE